MADTINTTETTHETKKPNAFVNFFKNNLTDKRYDSLGLIGAGVLCCVLSGAMGIVGIIFVTIGIFLSFSNINLVKLVEKLSKKQPKAATTVNNEPKNLKQQALPTNQLKLKRLKIEVKQRF
ncbi:cag1 [Helicobacter pylori Hp M5]|nr:cag1 [Helicobacter pylori Hp M5]